ncbi:hypothetical protein MBAV_006409 [Candidatus Magnetobacterium bavaricum]|uniref:Uncharacterized protein n=1 Tax=Candidatus Magnetobacterium bavaricum TaxID=29290 RepID=A0A0F3GHH7_9BACT|nr:hypothetical protein MBAV_006409 [Candidatus Magnetobacterium bavaricum]
MQDYAGLIYMMKHSCDIRIKLTEGLTWKRDKTLSNKSCQSFNPLNQGSDKKHERLSELGLH